MNLIVLVLRPGFDDQRVLVYVVISVTTVSVFRKMEV